MIADIFGRYLFPQKWNYLLMIWINEYSANAFFFSLHQSINIGLARVAQIWCSIKFIYQ